MTSQQQIIELNHHRLKREAMTYRVLHILRDTVRVLPVEIPDVPLPTMYVEMTDQSAQVIAPLIEALDILEAIIWASDGCIGHRECNHSMEPWQRARALLAGKWQASEDHTEWPTVLPR